MQIDTNLLQAVEMYRDGRKKTELEFPVIYEISQKHTHIHVASSYVANLCK